MPSKKPSRKLWPIYLRLLLVGSALAGVIWLGWLQWATAAYRAIPVEAKLLNVDRVVKTLKSGGGTLLLEYQYSFGNTHFVGDQAAFGSRWFRHAASSDMELQSIVDDLDRRKPSSIQIWIDPKNPQESALLKRVHPGLTGVTIFLAFALLLGVIRAFIDIKKLTMLRA
jgi:Protein of unknown function (DUF3592)